MRYLLAVLLVMGMVASANAQEVSVPADTEVIIFQHGKLGPVTFQHKMHSKLDGVNCVTCHHTTKGGGEPEDCHNCHKAGKDANGEAPKSIKAFHTRCRGCHQYTVDSGKHAGPVKKCTLCHVRETKAEPHKGKAAN